MKYFGLFMCVFYAGVGASFLFTDAFGEVIPRFRTGIGLLLLGYALVRGYMWRRKHGHETGS